MASQTSAMAPPPGVFVPVPTFYEAATAKNPQPALDLATQTEHAIHLARCGITGLVLLGSTGEAIHLSQAERVELVSAVRRGLDEAGFNGYPIMAGVLTNSSDEAIQACRELKDAGAQWALVLTPGYFGQVSGQQGIVEWFTYLADRSAMPILIYHYPGVTNQTLMTLPSYVSLAKHANIVGVKMSHPDVSMHMQVSLDPRIDHNKFRVYSGFGQQLGPIVMFGAAGVIDALAAAHPRTLVRLFKLAESGPSNPEALQECRRLQYAVSRAEEIVGKFGIPGIKHAIRHMLGMGQSDGARLPLTARLADHEWDSVRDAQEAIFEIERSLQ